MTDETQTTDEMLDTLAVLGLPGVEQKWGGKWVARFEHVADNGTETKLKTGACDTHREALRSIMRLLDNTPGIIEGTDK